MPNRDRKLAELAAIAQLFGAVNGPQVRAQEGSQQSALAVLGLLMQQQKQQEVAGQATAFHQDETANQAAQLAETKRYHDAEIGQAQAQTGARGKEVDDTNQARLKQELIQHLLNDPSVPHSQKMAGIKAIDPIFAGPVDAMAAAGLQDETNKAAPAFKAAYMVGAKDPKALQPQLDALKIQFPDQTFNNQDWTSLNSSLPASGTGPADARVGGLLGQGGDFKPGDTPAMLAHQQIQYPGAFDWLLGSKPGTVQRPQFESTGDQTLKYIKSLFGQ